MCTSPRISRVAILDVVEVPPGSLVADQFRFVQPDDRLGKGVVVAVADRSDRR